MFNHIRTKAPTYEAKVSGYWMSIVLGVDLGTQSIKALIYDYELRQVLANESEPLELYQGSNGEAEQDAQWWVTALLNVLNRIPIKTRLAVKAISVSGQQHGFVPLDKDGIVLSRVRLWCDTSTAPQCREIMDAVGGEQACVALTGNIILPGYTASKVLAFRQSEPNLYRQLETILLPHDYINYWLTGEKCMEVGDASGTGFLNIKNRNWSTEVLKAIDPVRDLSECLPELRCENEMIGSVTQEASEKTGLVRGTPLAIGGGDNMMAAIGTGNVDEGRATVSLGTSGTIYANSSKPIVDYKGSVASFCSSTGCWMPLFCTMNCTISSEIFRSLLDVDINDFDRVISSASLGSGGVLTVPFFNGERAPNLPLSKGCVFGLDSSNTSNQNLLRSGVEGATFALRFGVDELRRTGVPITHILLTGGGAKSAVWRQIVSDVMGLPVDVLLQDQGAAFGAALQAFCLLENDGNVTSELLGSHINIDPEKGCIPRDTAHKAYAFYYEKYQNAVLAVTELYN